MLGGGGNVTFLGVWLSHDIPLSLILVCTSGPQKSGMFIYVMMSRVVQLAGASDAPPGTRVSHRPVYAVISVMPDV